MSPWPFFKGTIPIAVRDWRNGAAWLKPWVRQVKKKMIHLLLLNEKKKRPKLRVYLLTSVAASSWIELARWILIGLAWSFFMTSCELRF